MVNSELVNELFPLDRISNYALSHDCCYLRCYYVILRIPFPPIPQIFMLKLFLDLSYENNCLITLRAIRTGCSTVMIFVSTHIEHIT